MPKSSIINTRWITEPYSIFDNLIEALVFSHLRAIKCTQLSKKNYLCN